jgi:predicted Zn-dependent protease
MNQLDEDIFHSVIKKLEKTVDYADIRAGESINNSIIMKDSKIDNVDTGNDFSVGIRVLQNGAWGFAYTTDINDVQKAADKATLLANQLSSDVELSQTKANEDFVKSNAKIQIEDITIEDKINLIHKVGYELAKYAENHNNKTSARVIRNICDKQTFSVSDSSELHQQHIKILKDAGVKVDFK